MLQVAFITQIGRDLFLQALASSVGLNITQAKICSDVLNVTGTETDLPSVAYTVIDPNLQVYSPQADIMRFEIILGSEIGDFGIGTIGLYSSTNQLVALATFPGAGQKIKSNLPSVLGNSRRLFVDITYQDITTVIANGGPIPSAGLIEALFRGPPGMPFYQDPIDWVNYAAGIDCSNIHPATTVIYQNIAYAFIGAEPYTTPPTFDPTKWLAVAITPASAQSVIDQVNAAAAIAQAAQADAMYVNPSAYSAVGDGTADDRTAVASADTVAVAGGKKLRFDKNYYIGSSLTINAPVEFGPVGKITTKSSGTTVTLANGFSAGSRQHIFDYTAGGYIWAQKMDAKLINQYHFGAVSDGIADDWDPLQRVIDNALYFNKTESAYPAAGNHRVTKPLFLNWGDTYRNVRLIGPGKRYGASDVFLGLRILCDHWGNAVEAQGARAGLVKGIAFLGPLYGHFTGPLPTGIWPGVFGASAPATFDYWNIETYLPNGTNTNTGFTNAGTTAPKHIFNRFTINACIHVDPRCGTKPVVSSHLDVRLASTTAAPAATGWANGDVQQGVTLATNDRILFALPYDRQGYPGDPRNGVYVVQASGIPLRATDMDVSSEFDKAAVNVTAGTYATTQWVSETVSGTLSLNFSNAFFRQYGGVYAYPDVTYPPYTGIATQYGKALSSEFLVEDCKIEGFACAFAIKGCDADGNGDYMRMRDCTVAYCVYGMAWGNGQARLFEATSCNFALCFTLFTNKRIGKLTGRGQLVTHNSELAACLRVLDISSNGGVVLNQMYGEGGCIMGTCDNSSNPQQLVLIGGGVNMTQVGNWGRYPAYWLDVGNSGVVMKGFQFGGYDIPVVIKGDPSQCDLDFANPTLVWPTGVFAPTTIPAADSIARLSTADIFFMNATGEHGPWRGACTCIQYTVAGASRAVTRHGPHALSHVTKPIPFCAISAAPYGSGAPPWGRPNPIPVRLGAPAFSHTIGGAILTSPTYTGPKTFQITYYTTLTKSVAQNNGFEPGCIAEDTTTGNIFIIQSRAGSVITMKQINNLDSAGNPLWPSANPNAMVFIPTGYYTPGAGLEITYTSGSATATFARADGTTSDNAQLPVDAAKVVQNGSSMTPMLAANSAIIASAAGSITLAGNARRSTTEDAGLWLIPR